MLAVFSTLIVFTVSLLVIRVATVGLTMTGISKDPAHFQALSAFTGSGFTTQESKEKKSQLANKADVDNSSH